MPSREDVRKRNFAAIALFGLIFSLSYVWQAIVPVGSEAPDESQHIQMVYFLKNKHRIPVFDQEKDIPSTYFFRTGGYGEVYYSMSYNSPLSYLPFIPAAKSSTDHESKRVILPMRLISGFFSGLFAVFLFFALFNFNRRKLFSAIGLTLFILLIPQIIYTSAYINIEPIALFLSALSLYFLSLLFTRISAKIYLYLGISLGLLALCKANYLIVVLYIGAISLWLLFRSVISAKQKAINFALTIAPVIVLNLWWWIRNIMLYRDPIVVNHISSVIQHSALPWFITPSNAGVNFFNIFNFTSFSHTTFLGLYAYLGGLSLLLPLFFYWAFYVSLIIMVLFGLYFIIRKNRRDLSLFLFSILIILVDFALYISRNLTDFSPQGRHLFPVLIPLAVILVLSLKNWSAKLKKYLLSLLVIIGFIANFYAILYLIQGYFIVGNAWVIQIPADKVTIGFTYHKFSLENYKILGLAVYSGNPAYSIYLSAFFAFSFLVFTVVILRLIYINRNEN